ncbi:MAG: hydrolase, partial [Myxococcales bacterium]|nr:hydrolase [Myxococcales bacterium]
NPDKFNGASVFSRRGIRVVTSAQVRALVPHVFEIRTRAFGARYAPDWPTATPEVESFGDATTTLEAGGLRLRAHVVGGGVSAAHVVVEWEGHVFVGDLVANGHHAWLELGLLDAWRDRLAEIDALQPSRVHPGRGASGGPELVERQRAYLDRVESIVAAAGAHEPTPTLVERLRTEIEAAYPGLGHAVFLRIGLPAVIRATAGSVR